MRGFGQPKDRCPNKIVIKLDTLKLVEELRSLQNRVICLLLLHHLFLSSVIMLLENVMVVAHEVANLMCSVLLKLCWIVVRFTINLIMLEILDWVYIFVKESRHSLVLWSLAEAIANNCYGMNMIWVAVLHTCAACFGLNEWWASFGTVSTLFWIIIVLSQNPPLSKLVVIIIFKSREIFKYVGLNMHAWK